MFAWKQSKMTAPRPARPAGTIVNVSMPKFETFIKMNLADRKYYQALVTDPKANALLQLLD